MTRHFLLCPLGTDPTLVRRCTCDPAALARAIEREAEAAKPKPETITNVRAVETTR